MTRVMKMTTTEFSMGETVQVVGERGSYVVKRVEPWVDGSILLYGGDTDPNGIRGFRAIMPDKLVPYKGKRRKADAKI
jgi:hypothetical protein